MIWAIILIIITGISFIGVYIDKYKFYKKNGYWYEDLQGGKYGLLIFGIIFCIIGLIFLVKSIVEYFFSDTDASCSTPRSIDREFLFAPASL